MSTVPYDGEFTTREIECNGVRLSFTDWNPQAKDTVVMVHGINVQGHTWDPIAHELATDRRVLVPDLRGHGDSSWAREGYFLKYFVSDLHELVRHEGLASFDLVGHSLGSRIGISYAGEHPASVRRLILSDTAPSVPRAAALAARNVVGDAGNIKGFRNETEARDHFTKQHPEWRPIFIDLHVLYQLRRNWADKLVFKADPDLFWYTAGSIGAADIPYLWDVCTKIDAPTLMLAGRRSPYLDEEIAEQFVKAVPDATVTWTDTGHYIPREAPELFVEETRRFLGAS